MEKKINIKAKKEIVLIFLSVFFIGFVYALTPPPLPDHFIGNVIIDGQNASVGTQIEVYVGSVLESIYNVTEEGKYDLYVKTGGTGDTIEFKVQDKLAGDSTRQGGETVVLDLSLTTTTTTTPPSSSGSSGGSGGGGRGGGSGSSGGSSSGGGIISPPSTTEISELESDPEGNTTQTSETEEQGKTSFGITGAVVGFLDSGKGIIAIAFVIVLGIGMMLIKFKPLKWIKKFSH